MQTLMPGGRVGGIHTRRTSAYLWTKRHRRLMVRLNSPRPRHSSVSQQELDVITLTGRKAAAAAAAAPEIVYVNVGAQQIKSAPFQGKAKFDMTDAQSGV